MNWQQIYDDLKKQRKKLTAKIELAEMLAIYERAIAIEAEDVAELEAKLKTAKNKCELKVRLADAKAELQASKDLYKSKLGQWRSLNRD